MGDLGDDFVFLGDLSFEFLDFVLERILRGLGGLFKNHSAVVEELTLPGREEVGLRVVEFANL